MSTLERRSFLRFAIFAPPAAAAAETLVASRGGLNNVLIPPDPAKVQRARDAANKAAVIEPYLAEFVDVRSHGLYDLLRVPAGVELPESHYFFTVPIGCPAQRFDPMEAPSYGTGKLRTLLETNSVRAHQLPPPEQMYIQRILFLFSPRMDQRDRDNLTSRYYFELMLGDKVVARAPLARCPVTGELADMFRFRPTGPEIGDGMPDGRLSRNNAEVDAPYAIHLERPVHLPAMMQYSLTIQGKPFTTAGQVELYAILDGIAMVGIQ